MNANQLFASAASVLIFMTAASARAELPIQRVSFYASELPEGMSMIYLKTGDDKYSGQELAGANSTPPAAVVNEEGGICIYGEGKHRLLGRIEASPSWKDVMVILVGSKQGDKDEFTGLAFPCSKADLPPGAIKIANLSPLPVKGVLGETETTFEPNEIKTIKLREDPGAMISVLFQYQEGGKWKRMVATQWAVSDQARVTVIAYKDPVSGNFKIKSIPLLDE